MKILLVEDSPSERELVRRAILRCDPDAELVVVGTGEDALHYLFGRDSVDAEAREEQLDMILLDLGLPGMGGMDVLRRIHSSNSFRDVAVVVLTGSDLLADEIRSQDLGATCFRTKPFEVDAFFTMMERLLEEVRP